MIGLLRRLLRARRSLAVELYAGIGGAVVLTMGASVVAWIVFARVGEVQGEVNDGSVPDMAVAFRVSQRVGALVDSAPQLTTAQTASEFESARTEVDLERAAFEESLAGLAARRGESEGVRRVRVWARTLGSNIDDIDQSVAEQVELAELSAALRDELQAVNTSLTFLLETAIDDQFFYTMTGYRKIEEDPSPRASHFTEAEVNSYRSIAELKESTAVASQLLASVFSVSNADLMEPVRERYEATSRQLARNLGALSAHEFGEESAALFERLGELSVEQGGVFDVRMRELQLSRRQSELLRRNREIANNLVSEVEALVEGLRVSTFSAARESTEAIRTGQNLLLGLNLISVTGAVLLAWLFVGRFLIRRLDILSSRMRRMAKGELEGEITIPGSDEVADMAAALEVFRRHALEVQRLNLVEKLANDLKSKNSELEKVLQDLRKAQNQIVMREKLAALGELTAGVAHEIKNPLNFVKNFSEVSEELLEELQELLPEDGQPMDEDDREDLEEICQDLSENLQCILQHGDRANRIVQDMLMMGRESTDRRIAEINVLVKEHVALAYHSLRATDPDFNVEIEYSLDESAGEIECVPQDLGRVVLNMMTNACHATDEKRRGADRQYFPTVRVETQRSEGTIAIRIRDNGTGIPEAIKEKIFNPFFTTKDTDKGTGLGLALSNDIVREHGGEILVDSEPGEYTEMTVVLPVNAVAVPVPD